MCEKGSVSFWGGVNLVVEAEVARPHGPRLVVGVLHEFAHLRCLRADVDVEGVRAVGRGIDLP